MGLGCASRTADSTVEASAANVGQRLHALVQTMLAVNDMFVMAQPRVASFFFEDVPHFLDSHQIRYSTRLKLSGKSGFDHAVDFLIPKSPQRPERMLEAIHTPNRNAISAYLFGLSDVREARSRSAGAEAEANAFLNDQEQAASGEVVGALAAYRVKPVLRSQRELVAEALAG